MENLIIKKGQLLMSVLPFWYPSNASQKEIERLWKIHGKEALRGDAWVFKGREILERDAGV